MVKLIETESRRVIARGWGQGENGELVLNGDRVSAWTMKKFARWMVVMVAQHRECT